MFQCFLEKCKTSEYGDAPQKGVECVFPMKYEGKIYNGCVPGTGQNTWCSTKGEYDIKYVFGNLLAFGSNHLLLKPI